MTKNAAVVILLLAVAGPVHAENWPQWRGPLFNGSTAETGLPTRWSRTENVAWTADLPGVAASTPIVWEDRVLLTGTDSDRDTLLATCLDRNSGKVLWRHDIARGIAKDYRSNFASASPVTDGKIAVFFYGNGDLVCFDMDGNKRWARNLQEDYGPFAFLWTFSSSPLLLDGKLYLQVLQRDVPVDGRGLVGQENLSYVLVVKPETGETLYRQVRPSRAVAESREAFSTPIPYVAGGRKQILIAGGDALSGHDPETGKELWRWGTWNPRRIPHWRLVPSPVSGDGVILACAPKRDPIYALVPNGAGRLDDSAIQWVSRDAKRVSSDVPTPAFYDGDFFVLSDVQRCLSRIEPRTGKIKWTIETPGRVKYEASPTAADGKIYIVNFDGLVSVIDAADGNLIRSMAMDQPAGDDRVRSSISVADGQLFIRTTRTLYCVGQRRGKAR